MSPTVIGFPARGDVRRSRQSPVTMTCDTSIDEIIDAAIEAAPDCLRRRVILQAIDWSMVAPHKVSILLSSLEQAHVAAPRWLSRSLLLAGHVLPDQTERHLPSDLAVLNRLNRATGEPHERDKAATLDALAHDDRVDCDVIAALVERLIGLSWDEEAVRLALAHGHRVPDALSHAASLLAAHIERLPAARIRLAGSSTTHTLAEDLVPAFAAQGWRVDVTQAEFGGLLAELMGLQRNVDGLIVLLDFDGVAPRNWRTPAGEGFGLLVERAEILANALTEFSRRSGAPLLINSIPLPPAPAAGLLDRRHMLGLRRGVDFINERMLDAAERSNRIIVIDADQALSILPLRDQVDPRLWYYGRIAYSADAMRALARAFAQTWNLLRRGPAKVLAVDLDNTLWGGVYGEDGVDHLVCGEDSPGNAFRAMQQECLRLKGQGLLLVALSKNEPDALAAFERHPGMLMKPDDFAAWAINWDPKPENIRHIAADLSLGLDSFVFLDDSAHERDAMRRLCPEVVVPEMPPDPADRPLWLRRLTCTWPLRLTAEDETRAAMYAAERQARGLRASAANFEDYLRGLEQRLTISHVHKETIARAAQMHQRTNQFNLTTLRSTEAEIAALMEDETRGLALLGRVTDRFGDHGIAIAATVTIDNGEAVIRSLLMSCRVIGREIERAFLGELLQEIRRRGVVRVRGDYLPTRKNGLVRDFYALCGFTAAGADEMRSTWSFQIGETELPSSEFVAVSWGT